MEEFVRTLIKTADLSVLTKRMVRQKYKEHVGKNSLDDAEKTKINEIVYRLLEDVTAQMSSQTSSENKEEKENHHMTVISSSTESSLKEKKLLTPSKGKIERNQEDEAVLSPKRRRKVLQKNELHSSPQKAETPPETGTPSVVTNSSFPQKSPSKACKQTTTESPTRTKSGRLTDTQVKTIDRNSAKSDDKSKNSPLSQTKSNGKSPASTRSPRMNVNEVLDEVMNSDGSVSVTEQSDSSTEEDDVKDRLVIDESENDSDEEKNWKLFSPYKPKKKNYNKKQKVIDSSDEDSESESESESNEQNKPCKRKAHQSFSLCSDDSQSPLKKGRGHIQRSKKGEGQIKTKGRNTIQKAKTKKVQSDQDTSSGEGTCSSDNTPKKSQRMRLVSSSDEDYSPEKNHKSKKDVKQTKVTRLSSVHRNTKSKISVLSGEESSSNSESGSGIEHRRKRRKLSRGSKPKQTNARSVKRKASVLLSSQGTDYDTDQKSSDSEVENEPKRRKLTSVEKQGKEPLRSRKRKQVMSSESDCDEDGKEDDIHKSESDECFDNVTSAPHHQERTEHSSTKGKHLNKKSTKFSSNSSSSEEEVSLAELRRTSQNSSKNESNKDSCSDDKNEAVTKETNGKSVHKKEKDSNKNSMNCSSNSSSSEEEVSLAELRRTSQNSSKNEIDSDASSDEKPLKVNHKKTVPEKAKKKSPADDGESMQVKNLRKICRAAGIFINSNRELLSCKTNSQKVRRLKQILEDAGMKGRPSMKKTEKIRLKKEAAELSKENIIEQDKGRPKRRVNSLFARNTASPKQLSTPPRKAFCRLKDIIDSEESD